MENAKKLSNVMMMKGIILILLGVIGIGTPLIFTFTSVFLFGILLTIGGAALLISVVSTPTMERKVFNLLISLLYLWLGITAIVSPIKIAADLTLIIALVFIGVGIVRFLKAIHVKGAEAGWLIFNSVIAIILGCIILAGWPISGTWVIGLFIAIELFFSGIAALIISQNIKTTN